MKLEIRKLNMKLLIKLEKMNLLVLLKEMAGKDGHMKLGKNLKMMKIINVIQLV